jgi:hypothetical protein
MCSHFFALEAKVEKTGIVVLGTQGEQSYRLGIQIKHQLGVRISPVYYLTFIYS